MSDMNQPPNAGPTIYENGTARQEDLFPSPQGDKPPKPHIRRVGSFTMALGLIAAGVLLLVRLLFPSLNLTLILQLSPVILIFLGIEILVANVRYRNETLKYDFLSFLLCLLLIFGSLFAVAVPTYFQRQMQANELSHTFTAELEAEAYAALSGRSDMVSLDAYVALDSGYGINDSLTLATLSSDQYVQVRVSFNGDFASRDDFLTACREVTDSLQGVVAHLDYASFHSHGEDAGGGYEVYLGDEIYSLYLDGPYQMQWDTRQMEQNLIVSKWFAPASMYVPEEDYASFEEDYREVDETDDAADDSYPEDDAPDDSIPEDVDSI